MKMIYAIPVLWLLWAIFLSFHKGEDWKMHFNQAVMASNIWAAAIYIATN